jgi:hypothetical protein
VYIHSFVFDLGFVARRGFYRVAHLYYAIRFGEEFELLHIACIAPPAG